MAPCMCQSRDVKNWLQQNLLPEVAGVTGEELYTTVIKIFDSFGSQNYILRMDYTKAFDVLDPQVTKALLKKHGWPDDLIRLLVLVWSNNRRFICWGHHVHPFPLQGPSMPQGDPWGPLICSLWVQAGINILKSPGVFISTYLDDRCIVADSTVKLHQQFDNWCHWSRRVGLLENASKTVVSARLRSHVDALSLVFPQQSVKDWVRVLGACSATTARVLCPVEGNRLSGALRTADLPGSLGVCFERSFNLLRAFALAKANFGCRAPTWSACSKLWTRCWSSVRRARFSSPWVRCILYGGNLHLDVCWATVLAGAIVRGLLSKGWSLVRPWVWSHAFAGVSVNLLPLCLNSIFALVGGLGVDSGRHELGSLDLP